MLSGAVAALGQILYTQYNNLRTDLINLTHYRQGGSATVWSTAGTTDYTLTATPLIQCGVKAVTIQIGDNSVAAAITFPAAYAYAPVVIACPTNVNWSALYEGPSAAVVNVTTTGCDLICDRNRPGTTGATQDQSLAWIAIGPPA